MAETYAARFEAMKAALRSDCVFPLLSGPCNRNLTHLKSAALAANVQVCAEIVKA